jgi:hypothetical protein
VQACLACNWDVFSAHLSVLLVADVFCTSSLAESFRCACCWCGGMLSFCAKGPGQRLYNKSREV